PSTPAFHMPPCIAARTFYFIPSPLPRRTVHANATPQQFGKRTHNVEPHANAALCPRPSCIPLPEFIEHERQLFGSDTYSRIRNGESHFGLFTIMASRDADFSLVGKLNSVMNQIH